MATICSFSSIPKISQSVESIMNTYLHWSKIAQQFRVILLINWVNIRRNIQIEHSILLLSEQYAYSTFFLRKMRADNCNFDE